MKKKLFKISNSELNINKNLKSFTKEIKLYTIFIGASLFANILCFFAILIHYYLP
uniref:Uncharacterized protein n=1 Tax=Bartonella rochalimae ATCC BAA-1498 TaxID=685782 RepID=E6YKD2_9HYPH|nr:exported hypothetical protein [Bartonella rochalimae ATCC BAA-1498]